MPKELKEWNNYNESLLSYNEQCHLWGRHLIPFERIIYQNDTIERSVKKKNYLLEIQNPFALPFFILSLSYNHQMTFVPLARKLIYYTMFSFLDYKFEHEFVRNDLAFSYVSDDLNKNKVIYLFIFETRENAHETEICFGIVPSLGMSINFVLFGEFGPR